MPHGPSGSRTRESTPPTIARLLSLASVLVPLTATFRLHDLPWKLDEEETYSYTNTFQNPPWQDVFLDAWAALCSLHPHCISVCTSLQPGTAHTYQLLVAMPHPPSAELQEMVGRCLRELSHLSSSSAHLPLVGRQESGAEVNLVTIAYKACHAAYRDMVEVEGPKVLSILDKVISEEKSGKCPSGGEDVGDTTAEWAGVDNFLGEADYQPPSRAVKSCDVPWLDRLRQALRALLSAIRDEDEDYLAVHRLGVGVLSFIENKELIPVLRQIDWSLRMTFLRTVCALPWAVQTILDISRSLASLQNASKDWSVSWIHPSLSMVLLHTPLPITPAETLADQLHTACPDISPEDCVRVVERGRSCLEECLKEHNSGDTSAPHLEAILIEHIAKNNMKVYPYLATSPVSPVALPWSCYACARLLTTFHAKRQTRLVLRGCSDEVVLPSTLPPCGQDIDAALTAQLLKDVQVLARSHLETIKYKKKDWSESSLV